MFNQPLNTLNKVGQATAKRLQKLGLENTLDLIFYYPARYEDFSNISNIKELTNNQQTTVRGKVQLINNRRSWKRKITVTEAVINDKTDSIKIIWFNQPFITKNLAPGDEIFISGKVTEDKYGLSFKNPLYEKTNKQVPTHTARIIPIYSLTQGVTQKQIRFLTKQVIDNIENLSEWLPNKIIKQYNLLSLHQALKNIHFPNSWSTLKKAQKRLGFDELFTIQLYNLQSTKDLHSKIAPQIKFNEKQIKNLVNSLSFNLTAAQKKCTWQIIKDLEKKQPMNRLLEGDVGSGKTVVAAIAMYNAALSGWQSVLMAPTEILARQHYQTLENILGKNSVSLITRTQKKIITNQKIIIGTQALIQKKITFKNLGLAIIDEQHRFGVKQRKSLQLKSGDKKTTPHFLSMTATPIPRTLALTIYSDLNLSIIDQVPKGRKKIITKLVDEINRAKAYKFIADKINDKQQVFVICPLIEESDKLGVKSVEQEYEKLKLKIFPNLSIAKLHGKLKPTDKEKIMRDFKNKKYDLLVATSVVEVGVDIPNATIMCIEGAERFGLAQLHQFRGRVGRSDQQSYCFLFTESNSEKTLHRLNALINNNNGFELAEQDLLIRGPGDVYGKEQSGFMQNIKIADINDHALIQQSKTAAQTIMNELDKYPLVNKKLETFSSSVHFE